MNCTVWISHVQLCYKPNQVNLQTTSVYINMFINNKYLRVLIMLFSGTCSFSNMIQQLLVIQHVFI